MEISESELVDLIAEAVREKISSPAGGINPSGISAEPQRPVGPKVGFYLQEKFVKSYTMLPMTRRFMSEWEVRRQVRDGQTEFKVPQNAILSPLAEDWLAGRAIRVVREGE